MSPSKVKGNLNPSQLNNIQLVLEAELERLKRPSGEIRENVIYIYEKNGERALETLRHEFLEHLLSQLVEPYREVANKLIHLISEDAYRRKEKLVEVFKNLICYC